MAKVITEIGKNTKQNSLRSACFMKSRLIRNYFLLVLGANNLSKKKKTTTKNTHKKKQKKNHHKDTTGNFLNWHDWLNSFLASAFSSVSTLFVKANAFVLNLLNKTRCLFD